MLYPEFDELVSYKNIQMVQPKFSRSSHTHVLGGQSSPFRGQGLEFDSVRQYVPGDDIRNLDWKVTARTGNPHLKIFQEERQRHIVLAVDMNASMRFGTRKTFKSVQAARIASIIGWQSLAHHDRITSYLFGDVPGGKEFFTPKASKVSFLQLLQRFTQANHKVQYVPLAEAFRNLSQTILKGSIVYFISDFMDIESNEEQLSWLSLLAQKCDIIFISVNDPADRELIPIGQLGVCSSSQEKFILNTDNLAGRQAYALQWQQKRENLYNMTKKFSIPLIEMTTESDVKMDLWLVLKNLAKKRKR